MDESHDPSGAGDDLVAALIVERDLWRQRATDCERRWEEFLALEAERAELRRQASESLTLARLNLRAERDEWQRRATAAEARLTGPPPDQYRTDDAARIEALQAERDEWRERAVRAEASMPSDTPNESPADDEREPPAKRPRGNWLG